jgi:hypothetical protein
MKTYRKRMGRIFFVAGIGKRGPYAVATHRIGRRTYAKATIGRDGATVGLKHRSGRTSYEAGYNMVRKQPYLKIGSARSRGGRRAR